VGDPRAQLAWSLAAQTTLRVSIGGYHQRQRMETRSIVDGDTSRAGVERATVAAVGLEVSSRKLGFRAEAYRRIEHRLRPWFQSRSASVDLFPEFHPDRIRVAPSSGDALGTELSLSVLAGKSQWLVQYALARHRLVLDRATIAAPRDQRHTVSIDWSRPIANNLVFNAAWYWHSGWPYSRPVPHQVSRPDGSTSLFTEWGPFNGARLPSYHRADIRVTRTTALLGGRLETFLEIFNLYDRKNLRGQQLDAVAGGGFVTLSDTQLPRIPTFGILWTGSRR
jgi:hypothetical protein